MCRLRLFPIRKIRNFLVKSFAGLGAFRGLIALHFLSRLTATLHDKDVSRFNLVQPAAVILF